MTGGGRCGGVREQIQPPENWEYFGESQYDNRIRYQNDCGLWLVLEGSTAVTWVGNYHIPVKGTKEVVGQFDTVRKAKQAALKWMKEHPNPWKADTSNRRSLHTDTDQGPER
jgi:hypothetical protein